MRNLYIPENSPKELQTLLISHYFEMPFFSLNHFLLNAGSCEFLSRCVCFFGEKGKHNWPAIPCDRQQENEKKQQRLFKGLSRFKGVRRPSRCSTHVEDTTTTTATRTAQTKIWILASSSITTNIVVTYDYD